MYKIVFLAFCFMASLAQAQPTIDRHPGETLEDFAKRDIPPGSRLEKTIKGNWGDPSNSSKLMIFYRDSTNERRALILQQVDVIGYTKLELDHLFGIGAYPNTSEIKHVLFLDTDRNGTKELVVVEYGIIRCSYELEDYDEETGKTTKHWATGSCDLCGYSIFEQKVGSTHVEFRGFTQSGDGDDPSEWDMCELEPLLKRLRGEP